MSALPHARLTMSPEQALTWALVHELPKRVLYDSFGLYCPISPMFQSADLGTSVDCSRREPGFPAALGDPDPDALAIERCLQDLPDHRLELTDEHGLELDRGLEGWHLDVPAAMVNAFPGLLSRLVHKAISRTSWPGEEVPHFEKRLAANGQVAVLRPVSRQHPTVGGRPDVTYGGLIQAKARKGLGPGKSEYEDGAFCPLDYVPPPHTVLRDRAEFSVWRRSLDLLHRELQGLSEIRIVPSEVVRTPWVLP